ncbi:MAG: SRPBCC family protein [Marmoricola sp.]
MGRDMQVSDSVVIEADALTIYDQVADPTQMSRWSPENTGATTPGAERPLEKGEVFDGSNKRGRARWNTECVVTAAEPGRRFAFVVRKIGPRRPFIPGQIASWEYTFEPVGDGTRVTETWTDRRRGWPDWAAAIFDKTATGGRLFSDFQRRNIARTLAAMKADFESQVDETA